MRWGFRLSRLQGFPRVREAVSVDRGGAAAGCGREEMDIGPMFAVLERLQRPGPTLDDIDLIELERPSGRFGIVTVCVVGGQALHLCSRPVDSGTPRGSA